MKKRFTKICCSVFALMTVISVILSVFSISFAEPTNDYVEWFKEDYSGYSSSILTKNGWSFSGVAVDFPNNSLRIKTANGAMKLTGNKDYLSWTNYIVSCKITVTDAVSSGKWNGSEFYTGLCFGLNSSGNGYELCLNSSDKGNTFFARLYNRASKKVCCEKTAISGVSLNTEATLKAVLNDKTVDCYVNDQKVFSYTATSVLTGTVGYRGGTSMVLFDDLTVLGPKPPEPVDPEKDVPEQTVLVDESFAEGTSSTIFTTENGWGNVTKTACTVADGKITTTGAFKAYAAEKFCSGSVSADICFPDAPNELKNATSAKSVYNGCLSARNLSASQEIRSRFQIKYTPSTQKYEAFLQSVYYDAIDIGASPKIHTYALEDFEFGKVYSVSLKTIGNYVEISLNGTVIEQGCFVPESSLITQVGEFGIFSVSNSGTVTYDNVRIVRYHAYKATIEEVKNGKISLPVYNDMVSGKAGIMRNTFFAGETVNVTLNPDEEMMKDSLYYSVSGVKNPITTSVSNQIYSFTMPAEDITIGGTFAPKPEDPVTVMVDDDFSGTAELSVEKGWGSKAGKYKVENGKLKTLGSFTAYASKPYVDGGISADITIDAPSDVLKNATEDKKVYTANLTARNSKDTHEIRSRFAIKHTISEDKYTAVLDVVFYDNTDYGASPKTASYALSDFAFGKTYHVELNCIGNYVSAKVDGVLVIERCLPVGNEMIHHSGQFGIATLANSADVTFDNVKIVKYKTFDAEIKQDSLSFLNLDEYENPESKTAPHVSRVQYYAGELVRVNISDVEGYTVDPSSLYYSYNDESKLINAFDSEYLCGFFMPYADTVISGTLIKGNVALKDIWFTDDFDQESLMIERGWNTDGTIKNGVLKLGEGGVTKIKLNNFKNAYNWSNYIFEADITVDTANKTSSPCVAMEFRCDKSGNGYEFGALLSTGQNTGTFRVYDRKNEKVLASGSSGAVKLGQKYHMTVVVSGNVADCYVDNELVFTLKNVMENACGTIGFKVSKCEGTIDNVVVRKVSRIFPGNSSALSPEDSNNQYLDPMKSPITGIRHYFKYTLWISCVSFVGFLISGAFCIKQLRGGKS